CCGDGLLEIKCPFKYKDILPTDDEVVDDKSYCLKRNTNGEIYLSTTHSYFDQIQGQMVVSEFKYCDFICWTNEGIFIERVYLDEEYEKDNFPKLKQFFTQFLLPELLTHSQENSGSTSMSVSTSNATPSTSTSTVQHTSSKRQCEEVETSSSDDLYCICKKDRPGCMIACDNPSCKVEWFHYACVNIKRAPKGAWFCPDCK
uniref:PHD-type domain-containing protein n=1 Tax=Amphimedon queenslandica TaxID=400682 RepID=A0A1X7UUA2_AMPQE